MTELIITVLFITNHQDQLLEIVVFLWEGSENYALMKTEQKKHLT